MDAVLDSLDKGLWTLYWIHWVTGCGRCIGFIGKGLWRLYFMLRFVAQRTVDTVLYVTNRCTKDSRHCIVCHELLHKGL